MKIKIDFGHPFFDEKTILELAPTDLDDFYANENEINRLNLFFVLEASLHMFQRDNSLNTIINKFTDMVYRYTGIGQSKNKLETA